MKQEINKRRGEKLGIIIWNVLSDKVKFVPSIQKTDFDISLFHMYNHEPSIFIKEAKEGKNNQIET